MIELAISASYLLGSADYIGPMIRFHPLEPVSAALVIIGRESAVS